MKRKKSAKHENGKQQQEDSKPQQENSSLALLGAENSETCHSPQLLVWVLRAILATDPQLRRTRDWEHPVFISLGLDWLDQRFEGTKKERVTAVREALRKVEREARLPREPDTVFENVAMLGGLVGLNESECDLVALAVYSSVTRPLENCFEEDDARALRKRAHVLAEVLGCTSDAIHRVLSVQGSLAKLKLVSWASPACRHSCWLEIPHKLESALLGEYDSAEELLGQFVGRAEVPELRLADYPHIASDVDLIVRTLEGAFRDRARGFHVLLYGEPGVGKTQLARAIGAALDCRVLEVASNDEDDDAASQSERLRSYGICQRYGERLPRAIALFDEMEDGFDCRSSLGSFFLGERAQGIGKGFTNRLLEQTVIPTIWCANDLSGLDRAFLRRFDIQIEVKAPPPPIRKAMLNKHLQELRVGEAFVDRIASIAAVTPADCQRATRVARLSGVSEQEEIEHRIDRVIDLRLKARGDSTVTKAVEAPAAYSLRYVNAGVNLDALVSGLKNRQRGNLLLHGPPGTGKTAFARHLREALGMPLVERSGSDLLSMWVGQTEKSIAAMFDEARAQAAILFLDEADSFLGARQLAVRSFEVSQTNELLVRMEAFEGIFLCATNRLAALDPACLRRFALKIDFKPLAIEQALELFEKTVETAGQAMPTGDTVGEIRARLKRMPQLSPGDFTAVWHRSRAFGSPLTAQALLEGIEAENKLKSGTTSVMGFTI